MSLLAGIDEELGSILHIKHVVNDKYPYCGLKKWE